MKNTLFFLFCALSLIAQRALGEGGDQRPAGDFGINRRVRTNANFTRVAGDISIGFRLRTVNGTLATVSTPSFYLGGRGNNAAGQAVEVDAGLDYDNGVTTGTNLSGWVPYIARSFMNRQERVNPRFWNGRSWVVAPRIQGNNHHLDYEVDSQGRLKLTVDALSFYWLDNDVDNDGETDVLPAIAPPAGTTSWPWVTLGQSAIDPATLDRHSVKRVTAITQPRNRAYPEGELDGTTLGCLFYNGDVYSPNGVRFSWTSAQTSQVRDGRGTGYDAPQTGVLADDAIWNGHQTSFSKPRVFFPKVVPQQSRGVVGNVPRTNSVLSQNGTEGGVSRYRHETVELRLRAFPVGYSTFSY